MSGLPIPPGRPGAIMVLGSGPVALAHALFAARHGPVLLAGGPAPGPGAGVPDRARSPAPTLRVVESVPAPLLTLLLELGVHPAELDVAALHRRRWVAWQGDDVEEWPSRASAHLERGALLAALWRRVRACAAVRVVPSIASPPFDLPAPPALAGGRRDRRLTDRVVDARGRRALDGRPRARPPRAWMATCCTVPREGLDGSLHLASAPGGYAYRLGSARALTVGWVAPRPASAPRTPDELRDSIAGSGAGWLLAGVALEGPLTTRVASVSVPAPAGGRRGVPEASDRGDATGAAVIPLGDAALARDALASQGLAAGLSDARLAARPDWTASAAAERATDSVRRHLRSLGDVLDGCRYQAAPAWREYTRWVHAVAASIEGDG